MINQERIGRLLVVTGIVVLLSWLVSASRVVADEVPAYKRSDFGSWIDIDRDCQNTREEVLIEESLIPVTLDSKGCKVVSGLWVDPYSGRVMTNPIWLDVDHVIPLREAWVSGAYAWTRAERVAFSNDLDNPDHLMAVHLSANRSKGSKDIANWMPANMQYWEDYLMAWFGVKQKWNLGSDEAELLAVDVILDINTQTENGIKLRDNTKLPTLLQAVSK